MSEVMLHGVLNAPIDPGDVMGVIQLKDRAKQASSLIYDQQKRIDELEDIIIRLHNTHPQDIAGMLDWWIDMFKLMPIKSE